MKYKLTLILLAAFLLLSACGLKNTNAATVPQTTQGLNLAPGFTVYDSTGKEFKLSDFIGKPVVVNFWASWCGPCKREMPDFQEAYDTYGQDVHFLMINLTDGYAETVGTASKFIADAGYTFPVYYDTASDAASTYGIRSIPTTYFMNAEGQIVTSAVGMLSAAALQQKLDLILP